VAPPTYCDMIRSKDHQYDLHLRMVKHAKKHGIPSAMRDLHAARNTVRT